MILCLSDGPCCSSPCPGASSSLARSYKVMEGGAVTLIDFFGGTPLYPCRQSERKYMGHNRKQGPHISSPAYEDTSFPEEIIEQAWERQGGRCAFCGVNLNDVYWDAHHRRRLSQGTEILRNCVLYCRSGANCHLWKGHDGDFRRHPHRPDYDMPFLHFGEVLSNYCQENS
jgi:hypothetical protein